MGHHFYEVACGAIATRVWNERGMSQLIIMVCGMIYSSVQEWLFFTCCNADSNQIKSDEFKVVNVHITKKSGI